MAKIEDISAQSFQFTEVVTPTAPASGRIKLYAKSDHGLYKQSSDGTETLLVPDTRYKGLRLARQIVLTGTAAIIEFNTDDDGNALNSTLGGELIFYSGTNASLSTFTNLQMQLNNISVGEYWTSDSTTATSLLAGRCAAVLSEVKIAINNINQNLMLNSSCVYRYSTAGNLLMSGGGMTTPQTAVTAIKLFLASGTFPAGTVVEWWERG